ncbi:MAG TPA: tetratricopeptide repeat protein [Terriglobales bacterium]|nr:tetratricopeptide repeat protein [Terriglobales bacterium]
MRRLRLTVQQSGFIPASRVASGVLAVIAMLIPAMIQAQSSSASATLQGAVRDSKARPVAGATVYLQVKDGAETVSTHSDAAGNYRFAGLREGVYMLRVEAQGHGQSTFGPCVLGPKETKQLDLTLEVGGAPEFFDEPQFTVAGVTDGTNLGGHGSNAVVRTKESLARDIASLSAKPPSGSLPPSAADTNESSLRATADREPGNFDANHRLGKSLVASGKAPQALTYLERASQLKPGNYENAYLLALAYADSGQYQRARANAQALLTAREKPGQKNEAELHHLLGDIEEKSGNPLEAVRQYQKAAELDPSEPYFFDWGSELLLHRAVQPAIEVFNKGNRLFPRSARMLVALGVAWYSNGSYDQAAQRLCEASDMNPNDPKAYLFLGKIQSVETTQSECSTERLARFAKLQPENALASYYYAVNLWKRRKGPDDAESMAQVESLLKKAVALDSRLGIGYLQLGVLYSERGDFARAVLSYQEAIKVNPELEEAHYRLAQAYKRTGDKVGAEQELQLYNQISKKKDEAVERERRESRQFVYRLRGPGSPLE